MASFVPIPKIQYAPIEPIEIESILFMTIHPKHRHTLGLPKTGPKNKCFSLSSRFLLLCRMQTHFEPFILIQCTILMQVARAFYLRFYTRACYGRAALLQTQKTVDTVYTMLTCLCFLHKEKALILKSQHHLNKYYIFSTSFAVCFCQSLTFLQLLSDSRQAMLIPYG